jgi:hypothetical protein
MKFILHIWTRNPADGVWCLEFDGGEKQVFKNVYINVPTYTKVSGHEPCANWYIEGTYRSYSVIGDTVTIS